MCRQGDTKPVCIDGERTVAVDSCIAGLVQALNCIGLHTRASCCGHGHLPPSIVLQDGRELRVLAPEQARALDTLIGHDIQGQSQYA